ncbi:DMT family transporter [Halovulum sp. GXIMD14793]
MTDNRQGVFLMLATTLVFALQDGVSRHLADEYNILTVVMIRYWFFAAFVIALSARQKGGLGRVMQTAHPWLQIGRGVLLVAEICVMVLGFVLLGLVEAHAIFAAYPLIIAALSGPVLGEKVGWRRWGAIGIGFVGMLLILRPGIKAFSPEALIALTAAVMFAVYGLMTRYVGRRDNAATSFFYTGTSGAVAITLIAPFWFTPMQGLEDWFWMGVLCISGALGHYLLIRAYEVAEASSIQPLAYFQLVFASTIGITVFRDTLEIWTLAGAALIISAGLYTAWRTHVRSLRQAPYEDRSA